MFFKRLRQKRNSKHLRTRIESCVNTVLDLNKFLGEGKIKPEILQQFERLKESLQYVKDDDVDEEDIHRIEQATNELLAEIRVAYEGKAIEYLYKGQPH
jgi:cell division FtsZ-interacting protein ZapD